MLLQAGADVSNRNMHGYDVLMSVCVDGLQINELPHNLRFGRKPILDGRNKRKRKKQLRHNLKKVLDVTSLLIKYGANVNTVDNDGFSLLDKVYLCKGFGKRHLIKLLAVNGAEVNKVHIINDKKAFARILNS